ncbi:hypothetical protein [Streptomyces sp. YIM 98790]|uniref:hypothetical protein n=1 Tax=Streptomyces sp. YIM 98790 TaxID=2689077 RepID=UPI00140A60C8|nr:hypothetical protein [Streptomyces sp. YIM 98790]
MRDPNTDEPDQGQLFDPDAALWTPGIDYVAGWRDAHQAAAELRRALAALGDTATLIYRADTTPTGGGLLHLSLPAALVCKLARAVNGDLCAPGD